MQLSNSLLQQKQQIEQKQLYEQNEYQRRLEEAKQEERRLLLAKNRHDLDQQYMHKLSERDVSNADSNYYKN